MATKNFLFDVKLTCTLRIDAESETEARRKLAEMLDCADVTLGEIDGETINSEVSIYCGNAPEPEWALELVEVDGEAPPEPDYDDGEPRCSGPWPHKFVVDDTDENHCYCERCGTPEY